MPRKNSISKAVATAVRNLAAPKQQKRKNRKNKTQKSISRTRIAATQRQRVTTRRGGQNRTIISGSEIVNSVPFYLDTADGEQAVFSLIPANPAYWSGTNIAQQAANYGAYRPLRWSYTYIPQVSVNHNGIVQVGTLWDTTVTASALSQTLQTSPGGCMSQVWSRFGKKVPLSGLQQKLYNMNGELHQATNPFFLVAFNRGATKLGDINDYVIPGTLVIHYTYAFYNKLGSSWVYGRENNFAWGTDTLNKAHANMSYVVRSGELPPVTVLDVDDGYLKYRGSQVSSNVAKELVGDVYWNDPGASSTESITVNGTMTMQYLTDIEYSTDMESWTTVNTYYGPAAFNLTYGLPGYVTVMVSEVSITMAEKEKYNCSIQAWVGSKKFDPTASSFFSGGYFCQIPFNDNLWIRAVSNLGKHSNLIYFSHTWTSTLTVTTDPPQFSVCPPWAGAKLEDHDIEPEEKAPNEDTNPEGFPTLNIDQLYTATKTFVSQLELYPQQTAILQPGLHHAIRMNGITPTICRSFTLDTQTLYDPEQFDDDYYIVNPDRLYVPIPEGLSAIYGCFPYYPSTLEEHTVSPTDWTLAVVPDDGEPFAEKNYYMQPNTDGTNLIIHDGTSESLDNINEVQLPDPPVNCSLYAKYGDVYRLFIRLVPKETNDGYTAISPGNFTVVPSTYPDGSFLDANKLYCGNAFNNV